MSRLVKGLIIIVAVLILNPIEVKAQTTKEALLALKKLQTRVQAGVSYRDYSSYVADAIFPVRLFIESQEAKDYIELAPLMKKITERYSFAGDVWNWKFSKYGGKWIDNQYPLYSQIRSGYPDVPIKNLAGDVIYVDEALPYIWAKASKEVDEAAAILAKEDSKLQKKIADVESLKSENSILKENVSNLNKDIARLKEDNEKLKGDNGQLKAELETIKAKKTSLKKK